MNSDLTWLPNSLLKDIPPVKVIYEEKTDQDYGGMYYIGSNELRIVYSDCPYYTVQSTIVHEFCHFIQDISGRSDDEYIQWEIKGTYGDSINRFFHSSPNEMEALIWQNKYVKDEYSEWWLRKLVMKE